MGTAESGARSGATPVRPGGELDKIPVLDVGTGVGYLRWTRERPLLEPESGAVFWRLAGRGSPGEDERGSNGGRRHGAGRLEPARGFMTGRVGSAERRFVGEDCNESMVLVVFA